MCSLSFPLIDPGGPAMPRLSARGRAERERKRARRGGKEGGRAKSEGEKESRGGAECWFDGLGWDGVR
eukprot:3014586-Rhodomonas_salina.2